MKKLLEGILGITLCVVLIFCLSSCRTQKTNEDGYGDGNTSYHSRHSGEMYQEGYNEAYRDFVYDIIQYEAVRYAVEHGGWHPEEAMAIIDAYENGQSYYGTITEKDYKDAVRSLYCYYEYFYNAFYEDDVDCGYENYE